MRGCVRFRVALAASLGRCNRCIIGGTVKAVRGFYGLFLVASMVYDAANGLHVSFCLRWRVDAHFYVCLIEDQN